ncbi:MAG: outer membrane protein assembly factor BamD [Gammaproteobacteria bacterium]|nr:outer membrane protein assembly factor BamD [Gammaproteobacteria bacterium]
MLIRLAVVVACGCLAGCAWMPGFGKDDDEFLNETTEQIIYKGAQQNLRSGNYSAAITRLQRLEARFPFGRYAEQAQLELIYANYMAAHLGAAQSAADRFIRLHPQHPNVDYAYYMKGLTAHIGDRGFFDRFFAMDESKRDTSRLRDAFGYFSELVARFPDSSYAKDARQRMIYLRNVLAFAEVHVANYYMTRGAYVAASNRARLVVEEYSQTPAAPEALAIVIEANWNLGLRDSANDALRVLALNYPTYNAFDDQGNLVLASNFRQRNRSWFNMVTFGLLDRPKAPPPLEIKQPDGLAAPSPDPIAEETDPKQRDPLG